MARATVDRLLDGAGRTYADQAGMRMADTPAPRHRLLVMSMLTSAPISAGIAVAATVELVRSGMGTPARMRRASRQDRVDAVGRAGCRRYAERTATALGDGVQLLRARYRDDLRRLREASAQIRVALDDRLAEEVRAA